MLAFEKSQTWVRLAYLVSLFFLLFLVEPNKTFASKRRTKALRKIAHQTQPIKKAPSELNPKILDIPSLESLEQSLRKYRNKTAQTLALAESLLPAKNWNKIKTILSRVHEEDELFSQAQWLLSLTTYRQAQDEFKRGRCRSALESAKQSLSAVERIQDLDPYAAHGNEKSRRLAETENLIGQIFIAKKDQKHARIFFERGFQRLAQENRLILIGPQNVENYARACRLRPDTLCTSWLQRLTQALPKKSEEIRVLNQNYPKLTSRVRPSFKYRGSQTYRALDLDQASIDAHLKLFFTGKNQEALSGFTQFLSEFPRSVHRYRAQYWMGQAMLQLKSQKEARQVFESLVKEAALTYYGLLASFVLNSMPPSDVTASTLLDGTQEGNSIESYFNGRLSFELPEDDPFLHPQDTVHLKRAQLLIAEKANSLAQSELKEIRVRDGLSSPFLFYIALLNYQAGSFHTCFQFIGEYLQRDSAQTASRPQELLGIIFPTVKLESIREYSIKYSKEFDLEPLLVLSLMKQESAFNEAANSSSGALGLMQLMPATASETEPSITGTDLLQAEENIRIGMKYLGQVLTRFENNKVFAIAAYNAGPNAVDRWIKERPNAGMLEFIESIPYRETRDYVSSIIRNYFWYTRRVDKNLWRGLDWFWKAQANSISLTKPDSFIQQNENGEHPHP